MRCKEERERRPDKFFLRHAAMRSSNPPKATRQGGSVTETPWSVGNQRKTNHRGDRPRQTLSRLLLHRSMTRRRLRKVEAAPPASKRGYRRRHRHGLYGERGRERYGVVDGPIAVTMVTMGVRCRMPEDGARIARIGTDRMRHGCTTRDDLTYKVSIAMRARAVMRVCESR